MTKSTEKPIVITTDGACSVENLAASSCVLDLASKDRPLKLVSLIGYSDSFCAELFAVLMGIFLVRHLERSKRIDFDRRLVLKTDSLVLIEGLSKNVFNWEKNNWLDFDGVARRNANLWGLLLELSKNRTICCQHVSLLSGDRRLRACDKSSRWATEQGKRLIKENGAGPQGRLATSDPTRAWNLIDLSDILEKSKKEEASESFYSSLTRKIAVLDPTLDHIFGDSSRVTTPDDLAIF